jgi:hypothetical protein
MLDASAESWRRDEIFACKALYLFLWPALAVYHVFLRIPSALDYLPPNSHIFWRVFLPFPPSLSQFLFLLSAVSPLPAIFLLRLVFSAVLFELWKIHSSIQLFTVMKILRRGCHRSLYWRISEVDRCYISISI